MEESFRKLPRISMSPFEHQLQELHTIRKSVEKAIPVLIFGPPCSGKSALVQFAAAEVGASTLSLNVGEQTDAKALLGAYTVAEGKPGQFKWRAGVVYDAATSGKWLILEDIQLISDEFVAIIRSLLDSRTVFSPVLGETVPVHSKFRLFACFSGSVYHLPISESFWTIVKLSDFSDDTLCALLPLNVDRRLIMDLKCQLNIPSTLLLRISKRLGVYNYQLDDSGRKRILADCADILTGHLKREDRHFLISKLTYLLCSSACPDIEEPILFECSERNIQIGRIVLDRLSICKTDSFIITKLSSFILEQLACAVQMSEPVLLVGETGTGKTSIVQHLAKLSGISFSAINMSQQSEASDLVGGYRPFSPQSMARILTDKFMGSFGKTFSKAKNADYLDAIVKAYKESDWPKLTRLIRQIVEKLKSHSGLSSDWIEIDQSLGEFEKYNSGIVFHFQEGTLVEAIRKGHWILLDEINLATSEILNILSGILRDSSASITLTERGDTEPIPRHPNFRLFACMNPATDVGKKDLPMSIRSRFTELYVDEADAISSDLLMIVSSLLGPALNNSDDKLAHDIAGMYYELKSGVNDGTIADGNRRRPLFNLRTLTRPIRFALKASPLYGIRPALVEGFTLAFITQLDSESRAVAGKIIDKHIGSHKYGRIVPERWTRNPSVTVFDKYVIETGPLYDSKKSLSQLMSELESKFVLTESVKSNILSLARGVMAADYSILLEGPTSSGKTSSVEYLALLTGHKFSRINNHEHTDLQEYIGSYVVGPNGQLIFKEGILLTALREGHWLVLDELNLAPSDVLEALNRLLDDNRELLVSELNEIVKPHRHFRLFATQNPAGSIYGGRKALSKAFRSRFIELCINDIPVDELEVILTRKALIAPSQAKKLSQTYSLLQQERAVSANVFAGRHALVTLRDLFRWAARSHVTNEDLARNGYICLAERMRNSADKALISSIICKVFKMDSLGPLPYQMPYDLPLNSTIVWTAAMKRLYWLIIECIKAGEPILLVGETGCGKTSVVQLISEVLSQKLVTLNCHQHTETSDLLGSQRPARTESDDLFVWRDGPLVQSMKEGNIFLLDEISLADDSVLERLNSVLEPGRNLTLAEAPGSPFIAAAANFAIIATMNPGGDYGKKELSPALRSRFTEIWVPIVSEISDIRLILKSKLKNEELTNIIEQFWFWYTIQSFGQIFSLRDLSAWIDFIQHNPHSSAKDVLDGGLMIFSDKLEDANVQSLIRDKLMHLCKSDSSNDRMIVGYVENNTKLQIGSYFIECLGKMNSIQNHDFSAPTTYKCAMRTARALQLHKPILLEGSPGVGKTALITALAAACGARLCRINLSDQTDLADLFGADLPVDGGSAGQFAWRDGPFLSALKAGDWVLLDELNLASQSVLEGLNACLDHRAAVYIPELDRTFSVSANSRIFGAQNPVSQGSGRKGLPRSFLNRFSIVWFDELKSEDYKIILCNKYPHIPGPFCELAVTFNHQLNLLISSGQLGREGRPWEFNLRDLFRWFNLINGSDYLYPVKMVYIQRFRNISDRNVVLKLVKDIFVYQFEIFVWNIFDNSLQVGSHLLSRPLNSSKQLLHSQMELLDSFMYAVKARQLIILTGRSGSGKSALIELAAELCGRKIHCMTLGPETDPLDLLGTFEQVDPERALLTLLPDSPEYLEAKNKIDSGASFEGCFEWVDGPLVRALLNGHWLVLDHANSASPSVLDRINCLLEPNGVLLLSEQGICHRTGQLRTIKAHPEFRLFMTVQSDSGIEVSRAMRNRGVELSVLDSDQIDRMAVIRSVCRHNTNSNFPLPACKDLRKVVNSSLLNEIRSEVDLDDVERFWKDTEHSMPMNVSDGSNHCMMFTNIVLNGSHQVFDSLYRNFGFPLYLDLVTDHDQYARWLHPSGKVWKTAIRYCNSEVPSDYEYPSDQQFYSTWQQNYLRLSIRTAKRAEIFANVSRLNCSVQDYLSLWTENNSNLTLAEQPLAKTKWDEYMDRVQQYILLKNKSLNSSNNLLNALDHISPMLKQAYLLTPLFASISTAERMLGEYYMTVLLEDFLSLFFECSIADYEHCHKIITDLKGLMKLAVNTLRFEPPPAYSILKFIDWISSFRDPNDHLKAQSKILESTFHFHYADCLLKRRFIKVYSGVITNESEILEKIENIRTESFRLAEQSIESTNTRQTALSLIINASTFIRRFYTDDNQEPSYKKSTAQSLLGFRQSLISLPANCFDLSIPIINDLDNIIASLISPVAPDSTIVDPIGLLRNAAIRACQLQLPVPIDRIPKISYNSVESPQYLGVREDDVVERDIELEFFSIRERGTKEEDKNTLIAELFTLCAKPDKSKLEFLIDERAFYQSFSSLDTHIDYDRFFNYVSMTKSSVASFYNDPQPQLLAQSFEILQNLVAKLVMTMQEFPDHDVLENLHSQTERFLHNIPVHKTALATATVALERILQKANDWEQYASKQFSLRSELESLTLLIIKYRRLELENWKSVFSQVLNEYHARACQTWPKLSELLLCSHVKRELYADIVKLLEEYIMSGQLGQFAYRLAFIENISILTFDDSQLKKVLESVLLYFKPISEHLTGIITSHKEPLESDLRAYLKTVHWSDNTYWAVKLGVEKSHRKMASFIRKVRELLDRPVSSVLVSHPYSVKLSLLSERTIQTPLDFLCDSMEERMAELRLVDDVAIKQRAVLDFLSECKSLGFRLSNKMFFEKCCDTKEMLILAASSDADLHAFTNCLHQFHSLRSATYQPHPDMNVRLIDSFSAVSGQCMQFLATSFPSVRSELLRYESMLEEGLYRLKNTVGAIVDLESAKSLLHDGSLTKQEYSRIYSAKTNVMCKLIDCEDADESPADVQLFSHSCSELKSKFADISEDCILQTSGIFKEFTSGLSSYQMFHGTKHNLEHAKSELKNISQILSQFTRSLHKFTFVSLSIMTVLLAEGYCRKPSDSNENKDGEDDKADDNKDEKADGMGMAEGQGEKNVNDEMEFEEQLTGLQSDEQSSEKVEKDNNEIEMKQDFDAQLEKLMIDDNEDKDDEDDDIEKDKDDESFDDQETDNVGSDAERQEMDNNWSDDDAQDEDSKSAVSSMDLENGETKDELMAGEYDNQADNTDEPDKDDSSVEDNNSEEFDDSESVNKVIEDLDLSNEDGDGDQSDSGSDHSVQNPNPDYDSENEMDLDERKEDEQEPVENQQNIPSEEATARKLDSLGNDSIESGVGDSNLLDVKSVPQNSSPQESKDTPTNRTVHDILQSSNGNSPTPQSAASERQLYEHATTGQVVTGRSDSAAAKNPIYDAQTEESSKGLTERSAKFEDSDKQLPLQNSSISGGDSASLWPVVPIEPVDYEVSSDALLTNQLAIELCEKLRLVLEPTERSRLQGDYKTGKRLNLRRIIPFIASGYRRDKIWLRRSRPAKRKYNINLCVDQSKSMREGRADSMALTALSALSEGLDRLEAGTVSIFGFGESVKEFSLVDRLSFADETSDFNALLNHLISSTNGSKDSWTLSIIISDGICHDHVSLRSLVNQCMDRRILPLLVIIDPLRKISELSHVEYSHDRKIVFTKYLNTIPFEHYIIVHELSTLPPLLADALQQWFAL